MTADAIDLVREWAASATVDVDLLPCAPHDAHRVADRLGVSESSAIGAVATHTGGILVDHGWLRVLGAGSERLSRALDAWNQLDGERRRCREGLLVADDAIGGFHAWFQDPRTIHYLAPDTLEWEDTGLGYADWLAAMLGDRLTRFYADLRWPGWEAEVVRLAPDRTIHVHPPLVASGPPLADRSRRDVPVEECWEMTMALARQLRDTPDGTKVSFEVTD